VSHTRRLAAILAADVAGYSRLIRGDKEGTLARLKAGAADNCACVLCWATITRARLTAEYDPDTGDRSTLDGPALGSISDGPAQSFHAICEDCAAVEDDELVEQIADRFGIASYSTNLKG